ncbi:hypothetical protein FGG08_003145 [Glutinoglossum americanum]|uniref:PNPLA domain-containing protein n=1 Tax=Glutinoglossum americanum TaxID=1670608 RepID=A0A9P8I3D5_9PEZI|nr:hypothetical protein FGG08_003145 [Glutinoglossum americanum]
MATQNKWIRLVQTKHQITLIEHKDAYASLPLIQPKTFCQTPALIMLIGKTSKSIALNNFLNGENSESNSQGAIGLCADPLTYKEDSPLIYVDCDLHNFPLERDSEYHRGDMIRHPILWPELDVDTMTTEAIVSRLYIRLVAPFSSVICFFGSDHGGMRATARRLASWTISKPPSDLPSDAAPRVLVVVETTCATFNTKAAEQKLFQYITEESYKMYGLIDFEQVKSNLERHFQDIKIIYVEGRLGRSKQAAEVLRERIILEASKAQRARTDHNALLTFGHFQAFFHLACSHFSSSSLPFQFVLASRLRNPVSHGFSKHLDELLRLTPTEDALWGVSVPLLASALVLDSCRPGMHVFPATTVFSQLYQETCEIAIQQCEVTKSIRDVLARFMKLVRVHFEQLYKSLAFTSTTASRSHRLRLLDLKTQLSAFRSHTTCLCCLMRMPEKVFTCGHGLCDTCVQVFGTALKREPYSYLINLCLLCGANNRNRKFRYQPPTAGLRILCLDGGGIKGIIPLVVLVHIQQELGIDCLFQDLFDSVYGTSSGGLITLGIFLMMWSPQECLSKFEELSHKAFDRWRVSRQRVQDLIVSYFTDCLYKTSSVENAFLSAFGSKRGSNTKVAVTATTARETTPCIFANYNGIGRRVSNSGETFIPKKNMQCVNLRTGYNLVRSVVPDQDISIKDASKAIKGLGTFQDGGLEHNNPIHLAMWEKRVIWPTAGEPDLVLSLGTGASSTTSEDTGSPIRDGYPRRLLHSFLQNIDGEKAWRRFKNTLSSDIEDRYHRINISFDGPGPDLDDVSMIGKLKEQATQWIRTDCHPQAVTAADYLLASLFYFELDGMPVYRENQFECTGQILCRLHGSSPGLIGLTRRLISTSATFLIGGRPITCFDLPEAPLTCFSQFKKKVQFTVLNTHDIIDITIKGITMQPRHISGFPRTVNDLIDAQGLDGSFGYAAHIIREKSDTLPDLPVNRKRGADMI